MTTATLVCIAAVAWLTAASIAVRSVSRIWLRHWVEQRLAGATIAEQYLERPQRLLFAASTASAALLVLAGTFVADIAANNAGRAVLNGAGVAAAFVLLGHIVPRVAARRWAARLVPILLPPLRVVEIVSRPVVDAARWVAGWREGGDAANPHDGLQHLLREGELEGVGKHEENAIISGVVEFADKIVRDVMTPREDIFALAEATPLAELAARIAASSYSRIPIYSGSLDAVIGVVHAFDVLSEEGDRMPPLRSVAFTAPTTRCHDLLFDMLRRQRHLAIVRDDEGHTIGLVTLEDLLEELVGDIRDDRDGSPRLPTPPAR